MKKVISPSDLIKIEKKACQEGCSEEEFMEKAGREIANNIEVWMQRHNLPKQVCLLAGKGNNGGDGYVACRILLERGFSVQALTPYPKQVWGPLCSLQAERFMRKGGEVEMLSETTPLPTEGVLVDALVGTGFTKEAKGELAEAIIFANRVLLPKIAVDIPSGLCAETGKVVSVAVKADVTIYLEFPKIGFFLEEGWRYVGQLIHADFGLPASYQDKIAAKAFLIGSEQMKKKLPVLERTRNKYSAGYVLTLASSDTMPGAGALASYAALRSGAGIVRWFYLGANVKQAPLEILSCSIEEQEKLFWEEMKRAKACIVGPGLGRTNLSYKYIRKVVTKSKVPLVIDADALFFLAKHPTTLIPPSSILTPHQGEWRRLVEAHRLQGDFLVAAQNFVEKTKTTLLVKGAPNFLFSSGQLPVILPFGNPGMATAGSGDVLSGILAALLAQKVPSYEAAILGCYLQGLAGDLAAIDKTEYSLIASDIIEYLPKAFGKTMHLYKGLGNPNRSLRDFCS